MTESSPSSSPTNPPSSNAVKTVSRRGFLNLAWGSLVGFLATSLGGTLRFLFPNVLYEPSQRFKAGKTSQYLEGVTIDKENRVWFIREGSKMYALWSRCTHLGCTPNWFQAESRFRCPCHGSNFNLDGDVIAGPAPKPLWRVALYRTPDGTLIVDKAIMENRPGFREKGEFVVDV